MSGTTLSSFIVKKVRFLGLNVAILLSRIKRRALERPKFILIWKLLIGINKGFMNARKSLTLAEKSYSYLKKLKIIFMKKMAHVGFELMTFGLPAHCLNH